MSDFNYIPPDKRGEALQKAVNDIYNPEMQRLVKDEVQSEIYDATKGMTEAEKYIYLRKRLERERRDFQKLQKLYEKMLTKQMAVEAKQ